MFRCNDCGCTFEEPEVTREFHGLEYGYENQYTCPNCGGDDYKDSVKCDICGEDAWNGCFCDNCKDNAKSMLKVDFGHFTGARMTDLIDLFNVSLDELYVEERSKR